MPLKSAIVERLLNSGQITSEEAVVLLDNQMEIPSIPNLNPEQIPSYTPGKEVWDPSKCSCHPSKGGSGICGCIRGVNQITY